jgi:ATP-dependent RNA helicase DHX36
VPLPDYRADLDERHGSTQKEIKMSNQIERRVEDLLSRSKLSTNDSASSSNVSMKALPSASSSVERPADIDKEKLSSQLRDLQNSRKGSYHLFFLPDDAKC